MPAAFTTWTVLPHDPIEQLAENLWRVSGKMRDGKVQRQMVLAKMSDGRVVVHNAMALGDNEMKALETWGTPALLFVPNGFHRQDARIWKDRYPKATVAAPGGSKKRVEKVVPVDVVSEQAPTDDTVRFRALEGLPMESVMEVTSADGVSLVFCDAVCNMKPLKGVGAFMMGPTGKPSVPRIMRMFAVKDKKALAAQLEKMAETPGLKRILFGHGRPVTEDAPGVLRSVVAQLRG